MADEKIETEKEKKKDGTLFKFKKNVAGKAATSGFGKAVLKKVLDDNTNQLMHAIKKIVQQCYDKKKGEEIINNIIKILLKAQFQIEKKTISPDVFLPADKPLRMSFALLCRLNNNPEDRTLEQRKGDFVRIEGYLHDIGKIAEMHLGPYLTLKNKEKMMYTVDFLGSANFMYSVWEDPECKTHRDQLCQVMATYNNPHINLKPTEKTVKS
eukprot:TRINITY_DN10892_c0_g1_i1.p1 TRINITY_DN10892_c0_g1~~TRINITY_DN10892_c0_g1_i1.p1  ORF type:complete len:211 (+),score=55.32 TRINITY_DN10892_c0_g1_i1:113-745(+)